MADKTIEQLGASGALALSTLAETQVPGVTPTQKSTYTQINTLLAPLATPPIVNVTGLGTGVATALAVNLGAAGAILVNTGVLSTTVNGALSAPGVKATGTWIAGGTATTTKPYVLIEPTGTTSTGWHTSGTALGINAAAGFVGDLINGSVNGVPVFGVFSGGVCYAVSFTANGGEIYNSTGQVRAQGNVVSDAGVFVCQAQTGQTASVGVVFNTIEFVGGIFVGTT